MSRCSPNLSCNNMKIAPSAEAPKGSQNRRSPTGLSSTTRMGIRRILSRLTKKIYIWCLTSHATIFQSHMWRHRCAGRPKKMYLRSGSQRHSHFARFLKKTVNCSVHARTPGSVQEPEVRPGAREESASPAWLATPAKDAHNPANIHV